MKLGQDGIQPVPNKQDGNADTPTYDHGFPGLLRLGGKAESLFSESKNCR